MNRFAIFLLLLGQAAFVSGDAPAGAQETRWDFTASVKKIREADRALGNPSTPPAEKAKQLVEREGEVKKIESAGNQRPTDPKVQREAARALIAVGESGRALPFADRGVALAEAQGDRKGLGESLVLRARLRQNQGLVEQAYADSARACGLDPADDAACQTALMSRGRKNQGGDGGPNQPVGAQPVNPGAAEAAASQAVATAPPAKGLRVAAIPSPGQARDPRSRIAALSYEPRIKKLLGIMVENADPYDTENTLSALEKYRPRIRIDSFGHEKNPVLGLTEPWGPMNDRKFRIEVSPGYAVDPKKEDLGKRKIILPPLPGSEDEPEASSRLMAGKAVPLGPDGKYPSNFFAVDRPEGPRKDLGFIDGAHVYQYEDGTTRHEFTDEHMTGVLMHEIQHVRRDGEGGGKNAFTNERDAFDVGFRFYARYQEKHGGRIEVQMGKSFKLWKDSAKDFHKEMEHNYTGVEIRPGEVNIPDQLAATRRRYDEAKKEEATIAALNNSSRSPAVERLEEDLIRLGNDAKLSLQAEDCQSNWRAANLRPPKNAFQAPD